MARTPIVDLLNENLAALNAAMGRQGGAVETGEAIRSYIIRRTDLGRDVREVRFEPYAGSTRKRKRRKGQRLQPVSLRDTEEMMNDMEVIPVERSWGTEIIEAVIRFRSRRNAEVARLHSNPDSPRSKLPLREFLGIDESGRVANQIGVAFGRSVHAKIPNDRRVAVKLTIFKARRV